MYLYAEKFVGGYTFDSGDEKLKFDAVNSAVGLTPYVNPDLDGSRHSTVRTVAAYWRKANHIHSWFVDNVQDGKDDCGYHYVSREELTELRTICIKALEAYNSGDKVLAEKLLTPKEGFFFGSYNIDDRWADTTKYTVEAINHILEITEPIADLYYHSSW